MSSDKAMQIRTFGRPDSANPPTTFVQADPSNFRAIVQKLTGADDPVPSPRPSPRPPVASLTTPAAVPTEPSRPGFKLHERRQRKLETIQLGRDPWENQYFSQGGSCSRSPGLPSGLVMASPVSPLELFMRRCGSGSPGTPSVLSPKEEEEKAIAEKGFYLHPVSTLPRLPELLPLFPLHSPRKQLVDDATSASSSS